MPDDAGEDHGTDPVIIQKCDETVRRRAVGSGPAARGPQAVRSPISEARPPQTSTANARSCLTIRCLNSTGEAAMPCVIA